MTDRMTIDEARERVPNIYHLSYHERDRLLALLDHLAARVEDQPAEVTRIKMAGDELAREGQRALHGPYLDGDPRLEDYDAALARWEGLSK